MITKCKKLQNYEIFSYLCIRLSKTFNSKTTKRINTVSSRVTLLMREAEEMPLSNLDSIVFNKRSLSPCLNKDGKSTKTKNDFINFSTEVDCEHCMKTNELNFLLLLEKKSDSKDAVWKCIKCLKIIKPRLRVQINNEKIESFDILSPYDLFMDCRGKFMTNNQYKIDIESFRKKYRTLFYNCLLYFSMRNLSFDFLIPYQKKIECRQELEMIEEGNAFSNLEISTMPTNIAIEPTIIKELNKITKVRSMSMYINKQKLKKKGSSSVDYDLLTGNKLNLNVKDVPIKRQSENKLAFVDLKL